MSPPPREQEQRHCDARGMPRTEASAGAVVDVGALSTSPHPHMTNAELEESILVAYRSAGLGTFGAVMRFAGMPLEKVCIVNLLLAAVNFVCTSSNALPLTAL